MVSIIVYLRSLCAVFLSAGVTHLVIPHVIAAAYRLSFFDRPDTGLKNHRIPTPYLGGLAVYIGSIVSIALLFPITDMVWFLIVGVTLLLFVGLIDDLIVLRPSQKWWGQVIAACCIIRGGFYSKELFLQAYVPSLIPYLWPFVAMGWILTIINAFNLIDVMDGLATTNALAIASALCVVAATTASHPVMILLASLIGSLAAFFVWNRPVAKLYLGDSGALAIGGFLGAIPFMIPWGAFQKMGFCALLLIFFVPLAEVALLIIIRTWRGIPFYQGSPDHFCHYLQHYGWSIYQILSLVLLVTVSNTLCALLFMVGYISFATLIFYGFCAVLCWVSLILFPRRSLGIIFHFF